MNHHECRHPCSGGITCPCTPDCPRPPYRPPCPPEQCRCGQCAGHGGGKGVLLPRVIASGREWLRRQGMQLCVEGLPECAEGPFTLMSVWVVGEATWVQEPDVSRRMMCLRVKIPLLCQVRDSHGCMHCARAWVEVDASVHLSGSLAECWRSQMLVHPCVRLVCPPCTSCDGCFDVQLEILVECWMVHWECCPAMPQKPECPPLPLYPQPRRE